MKEKILVNNCGGFCYEFNFIMYYFLKDFGFDVYFVLGIVYNVVNFIWVVDFGYIVIVLIYYNEFYLIEVGFGLYLFFVFVFFLGEVIYFVIGDYCICKEMIEKGNYILEMWKNNEFLD